LAFGFGIAASILAVYSSFNARKLSFELRDLTIESVAQRQELKIAQAKLGFALAPQTEVLILTGQRAAPKAKAKLVWDPVEGQGILIASGLVPAPADKSYQFWAIAGGKPVAIKTFNVDSTGSAEVKIAHLPPSEHIFAFNVTLELAGGVVEPTGEKLLSGARL
jgi:anti-sigma-K factor RskA